jgi:hypothetical protein
VTDHYFDICVHGIPWCHCGCDDPGFDDDDVDDVVCPECGETECDLTCSGALLVVVDEVDP